MCEMVSHKSSQSGMTFCDLKMVEKMLNHQIELFCNKSRPWLAMVWVIPVWDDPRWPTFNMPPMQNIVQPVDTMHNKHVHLKLIKFWVLFFRSWQHMFIPVWDEPMCAMVPHNSSQSGMTFLWEMVKKYIDSMNHQIELFCNKYRPWLAMAWVIPGWDDPR